MLEIPIELTIMILVLAIVLPIGFLTFLAFEQNEEVSQVTSIMDRIVQFASDAFDGAPGTLLLLSVQDLPSGTSILIGSTLLSPSGAGPLAPSFYLEGKVGTSTFYLTATTGGGEVPLTNVTSAGSQAFHLVGSMTLTLQKEFEGPPSAPGSFAYVRVGGVPP